MTFGSVTLAGVGTATGLVTAGAWFFPFLIASIAYYHHTLNDPERKPIDRANLYR